MEQRQFSPDGPRVSVVGLGCNNFGAGLDAAATASVVGAALDAGINHFDTAEMYGEGRSEEFLGLALETRRDEAVIATKVCPRPFNEEYRPGALEQRIIEGCDLSLRRLRTDRIDIYYQHLPDPAAPIEEALAAFDTLVKDGKVLHVACSNYSAEMMEEADELSRAKDLCRFEANQVEWNLLRRSIEGSQVPAARRLGMTIIPFYPLGSGLLTGKYRRDVEFPAGTRLASGPSYFTNIVTEENFDLVEKLTDFAQARGHSVLELAVSWLLAQDVVPSVIAGATSAEQVRQNAAAANWKMTAEDLEAVPGRD